MRGGGRAAAQIITRAGLVNVDFADIATVLRGAGSAMMGVGVGVGAQRARDAAIAAISSPLLVDFPFSKVQ